MSGHTDAADSGLPVRNALAAFTAGLAEDSGDLLVALSGGPDSVALLAATLQAARPRRNVRACWVDHAIRPEAELDAELAFVTELCDGLGVRLMLERAARGRIEADSRTHGGLEAAARKFRYEALERARTASACEFVLTGHNADDRLETLIMRFCSGAGTAGLRGIPAAQGRLRRPLLEVPKASIYAYLSEEGLGYRVDSTNTTDVYLRNRVRHELVPAMLAVFPNLGSSLATLAEKAAIDEEALDAYACALLDDDTPGRLSSTAFQTAPLAVRIRALYTLAGVSGEDRLPWRLVAAAARSTRPEGRLASGAGFQFIREGGALLVEAAGGSNASRGLEEELPAGPDSAGFCLVAPGFGEYRIGKAGFCRIYSATEAPGLRVDSFSWPLCLRGRRPGDAIHSSGGRKKLDDLASGMGVSAPLRDRLVVLEDRSGIVAVLGAFLGGRDVYRRNDHLVGVPAALYAVFDLKGVAFTDAV